MKGETPDFCATILAEISGSSHTVIQSETPSGFKIFRILELMSFLVRREACRNDSQLGSSVQRGSSEESLKAPYSLLLLDG